MSLCKVCAHKPKAVLERLSEIADVEVRDVEQISPFPSIFMHVEGSRWSSGRPEPKVIEFNESLSLLSWKLRYVLCLVGCLCPSLRLQSVG